METVTDEAGRITIPEELRTRLGLKPGMILSAEESRCGITFKVLPEANDPLLVREGNVLVYKGEVDTDFDPVEFIDKMRNEDDFGLRGARNKNRRV